MNLHVGWSFLLLVSSAHHTRALHIPDQYYMHHMAAAFPAFGIVLSVVRYVRQHTVLISPILTEDRAKSLSELGDANEQLM